MSIKKNRLLAIAINDYDDPNIKDLNNPINDINLITQVLTTRYTFQDFNIVTAKNDTKLQNLHMELRNYLVNAMEEDSIMILFAGHGEMDIQHEITYWLPSNARKDDPTSWLNLQAILAFIKKSKAKHISIISDCCFSGGLFETARGGGIYAFENRKSREALTSGSIEKVLDGDIKDNSPFAKLIIKILTENKEKEMTFSSFGNKVITEFGTSEKQTPRFDPLVGVGHDGGSLILELIESGKIIEHKKELETKLRHLLIKEVAYTGEEIESLKQIIGEKNSYVYQQKYSVAAEKRDTEKRLQEDMLKSFSLKLEKIVEAASQPIGDLQWAVELSDSIKRFNTMKKAENKLSIRTKYTNVTVKDDIDESVEISMPTRIGKLEIKNIMARLKISWESPDAKYFEGLKGELFNNYKVNVMELLKYYLTKKSIIKSEFLDSKLSHLIELLREIYLNQISLLTSGSMSEIRKETIIIELEFKLLKWIEN